MCELLVGLPDVNIEGVGEWPHWLRIEITRRTPRPTCRACGGGVHDHGRRDVALVDLPVFGRPARLVWAKQRWRCPNRDCSVGTWTEVDERTRRREPQSPIVLAGGHRSRSAVTGVRLPRSPRTWRVIGTRSWMP